MICAACGADWIEGKPTCVRCGRVKTDVFLHLSHDLPEGLPTTGRETNKENHDR